MSVLSVGLAGAGSGGYQIPRSLRFRSSASAYLSRTFSGTGNQKTATYSEWVKRGVLSVGSSFASTYSDANNYFDCRFHTDDKIRILGVTASSAVLDLSTAAVFRDPSAHYHIVIALDTTQATAADRVKVWVNGVAQTLSGTSPALNANLWSWNSKFFGQNLSSVFFDGYLSEVNFIDGQALTPSSFGETSATTGQWQAKRYTGTYGTNGFYLPFSDTTSTTTIVADSSGNGNNWTATNISLTAGATYDSMTDVPLGGGGSLGNGQGNYATINQLDQYRTTISGGNLNWSQTGGTGGSQCSANWALPSGLWYWECVMTTVSTTNMYMGMCLTGSLNLPTYGTQIYINASGTLTVGAGNGTAVANGPSFTSGDTLQFAFDQTNGKLWFGKAGTWSNSGDPAAGTNANVTGIPTTKQYSPSADQNIVSAVTSVGSFNFGQRPFAFSPPTGFKALHTGNLSAPAIAKPNQHFDAKTHTGNNTTLNITGVAFRPDFAWVKSRSNAYSNIIMDSVRGAGKLLTSDTTSAETGNAGDLITAFNSDGITVNTTYLGGANASTNGNASTFVDWLWKAGGTGVSNTNGTITSTVSANTTAGVSIVTYTGTGANATVGHGLGVAPKMVIVKNRTSTPTYHWFVYHAGVTPVAADRRLLLNDTGASAGDVGAWNNTAPTSSVFSIGNGIYTNSSGISHVAYCFAEIAGYSKFGSYTANNSADGPFVYCGFRPKFLLVKASSIAGEWYLLDSSRDAYNLTQNRLFAQANVAEGASSTNGPVDFLSNGFKVRSAAANNNNNGSDTYIFAAFAEAPFQFALAR